jgi:hypothetical protein
MVGLNQLMGSQPSFYNGYRKRYLQIDHYLLNRIVLYVSGVSIVQLYKSDFLVDIYFGGYMKGKKNTVLFYFIINFCLIYCEHIIVS